VPWILCVGETFNSKETHNNQNIGLSAKGSGSQKPSEFCVSPIKRAAKRYIYIFIIKSFYLGFPLIYTAKQNCWSKKRDKGRQLKEKAVKKMGVGF